MKNVLLAILLMFVAMPVFAQETQTDPNTASAQLNEKIAKMTDAQKADALATLNAGESATAARAREWIEIGNGLGEGLAATAQKMGVVTNEFAQTSVGKMAMVLIIWNYMGDDITGWIAGLMMWFLGIPLWLYQSRKVFGEYNEKGKFVRYDPNLLGDNTRSGFMVGVFIFTFIVIFISGCIFIA